MYFTVVFVAGGGAVVSLTLQEMAHPYELQKQSHFDVAERHGVTAHSYADDTLLYVHTKTQHCATEATRLTSCVAELDS